MNAPPPMLAAALGYAARGWPVFPCVPGGKTPTTMHGFKDASTDPGVIHRWFGRTGAWNVAIATGQPGPDVLDVDHHGPHRNGFPAFRALRAAGLGQGAAEYVRTPSGGMHVYYAGTGQRNGHLAAAHLDFRSAGGYVLAPPSVVDGRPYRLLKTEGGGGRLDWAAVTALLAPPRPSPGPGPSLAPDDGARLACLARWVAVQAEGNRNAGLFWAACRALDEDPAADLVELAAAAEQSGLSHLETARTLDSARRTPRQQPAR